MSEQTAQDVLAACLESAEVSLYVDAGSAPFGSIYPDDIWPLTVKLLEALGAAGYAVIKVTPAEKDPERGDDYWPVPLVGERLGKLRIDSGYRDGPRISSTRVPTPLDARDVPAYVGALLGAAAVAEDNQ